MDKNFDHTGQFEHSILSPDETISTMDQIKNKKLFDKIPLQSLPPSEYFTISTPYISQLLVTPENYTNIQNISQYFPSGITDFLGFECRLSDNETQADWALAISGVGKARHIFSDFLNNGHLPESFKQTPGWQHIHAFSKMWTDKNSILHDNIMGAWLEFDMPDSPPEVPIPSVFFNPTDIRGGKNLNPAQYEWFCEKAIPSLTGHKMAKAVKRNVQHCIQKMPKKSSLFIVGVMLSRISRDIRMSVLFRDSTKIMSYLGEIGGNNNTETFGTLISDLDKINVNRMVLDFDVGKKIGKKIAVECSFYPNRYHQEKNWKKLLDFLVKKEIVTAEKCDELLRFPGKEVDGSNIIRYITHVKIVYEPGKPLRAKAYLAIRHFLPTYMMQ